MLSPVTMPETLTRNNWKQKHSKTCKWFLLRSTLGITVLREPETTEQMTCTIDRVTGELCSIKDSQPSPGEDIPTLG